MLIYRLLKYLSVIVFSVCVFCVGVIIYHAIRSVFKKEKFSFNYWLEELRDTAQNMPGNSAVILLVISLFGVLITNTAVHQLVGVYNLKLLPEGTYCFYVEATQTGGKTYTLPAQVEIDIETVEESNEKSKTYAYYHIEKVFFSNGGYIDTDDGESDEIGKTSYAYDSNDDEWKLVLLNEHAYSPDVIETNNAQKIDIIFLLIDILPIFFVLFALCKKGKS